MVAPLAACNFTWSSARIAARASRRQLTRVPAPHATSRTARSAASRSSSASKSIMLAYSSHYRPCAAISAPSLALFARRKPLKLGGSADRRFPTRRLINRIASPRLGSYPLQLLLGKAFGQRAYRQWRVHLDVPTGDDPLVSA